MNENLKEISIKFSDTSLRGDILFNDDAQNPNVLFLHGAGQSERKRFFPVREMLLNHANISSCAFDFIGHGETGGQLESSSLQERTDQASAVVDSVFGSEGFSIVAASMSAYTAMKLTQLYNVNNLILMVPAVYWNKAYSAKFGGDFTDMIRIPYSWKKTDAWSILNKFDGNVCVINAENDRVIPVEIISEICLNSKHCRRLEIKDSGHQVLKFISNDLSALNKVYAVIVDTLSDRAFGIKNK